MFHVKAPKTVNLQTLVSNKKFPTLHVRQFQEAPLQFLNVLNNDAFNKTIDRFKQFLVKLSVINVR